MSKKKINEGNCCICGKSGKLSFEHIPPRAAFNDKPIYVQSYDQLLEENSRHFGKKSKNNKGFGGYTLCQNCNNNTGSWYGKDFTNFAQQGMSIIKDFKTPFFVTGLYDIKPLNVVKQILSMFMSADKSGHLSSQKELVDFILIKELTEIPKKYKIFLYSNFSLTRRLIGHSIVYLGNQGIHKWSEINFKPFGYFFTEESEPADKSMCDISYFGNYKYDEQVKIKIITPYLKVSDSNIGMYY